MVRPSIHSKYKDWTTLVMWSHGPSGRRRKSCWNQATLSLISFVGGCSIRLFLWQQPTILIQARLPKPKKRRNRSIPMNQTFFVSTNDIITSAFGKSADCGVLVMALDLRGRTQEAGISLAGNYETLVWYDKGSFDTPAKMRHSLSRGPPFKRVSGKGPMTRWQEMTTDIAIISSWAFPSFEADIHLWRKDSSASSSVMLHLPLYVTGDAAPIPSLIVFKPCKGRLAIVCFCQAKKNFHKGLVDSGKLLGETVSAGMFASNK
mmetsp:Transcript_958/g.1863  ORF Transcript_958/g.1863 Transcript_958/m.1863 type:complete len:262 (-) Transcript_958:142-927(-)